VLIASDQPGTTAVANAAASSAASHTPIYGTKRKSEECLRHAEQREADSKGHPDAEIDRELRDEEPREPLARIVDCDCGQSYLGSANNTNESITQSFVFEQQKYQDDENNAGRGDRLPDRGDQSCNDLQGRRPRLPHFNRDRRDCRDRVIPSGRRIHGA
jgi:hypothetical protein